MVWHMAPHHSLLFQLSVHRLPFLPRLDRNRSRQTLDRTYPIHFSRTLLKKKGNAKNTKAITLVVAPYFKQYQQQPSSVCSR
jgi:hypothetical protein